MVGRRDHFPKGGETIDLKTARSLRSGDEIIATGDHPSPLMGFKEGDRFTVEENLKSDRVWRWLLFGVPGESDTRGMSCYEVREWFEVVEKEVG